MLLGLQVMFLPFYVPAQKKLKVVIIGGGCAGIAAVTALSRYASDAEITIIDPKENHIKVTHLHETFRYPLSDLIVPFTDIEKRFNCRHICAAVTFDISTLQQWQEDKHLNVNNEIVSFDYLLVATGASSEDDIPQEQVLSLSNFMRKAGSELLNCHDLKTNEVESVITVVGGGATGIQFLFELQQFLCRKNINFRLRLIHAGERVLERFPEGFSKYVQSKMADLEIDFYPKTYFREQQANQVVLESKDGTRLQLPSQLSLFLGKKQESTLNANIFGQAIAGETVLNNIFVAGDVSHYNGFGSNTLTAQSAVRKGKLAAKNILRHSGLLKVLEPYLHRNIGYVVSLGSADAVGWLVSEGHVVTGIPALAIKELVEMQYDLLLKGVDTYLL